MNLLSIVEDIEFGVHLEWLHYAILGPVAE
jgi:hypothetical protein